MRRLVIFTFFIGQTWATSYQVEQHCDLSHLTIREVMVETNDKSLDRLTKDMGDAIFRIFTKNGAKSGVSGVQFYGHTELSRQENKLSLVLYLQSEKPFTYKVVVSTPYLRNLSRQILERKIIFNLMYKICPQAPFNSAPKTPPIPTLPRP